MQQNFSAKNKISIKRSHSASFLTYIVSVCVCVSARTQYKHSSNEFGSNHISSVHTKSVAIERIGFIFLCRFLSLGVCWFWVLPIRADPFWIQHSAFKPHHHSYFSFWMPCNCIDVEMHSQYLSMDFSLAFILFGNICSASIASAEYGSVWLCLAWPRFWSSSCCCSFHSMLVYILFSILKYIIYRFIWTLHCFALNGALSLSLSLVLRFVDFSNAIFYYYCFHPNCFASIKKTDEQQQQQQSQR